MIGKLIRIFFDWWDKDALKEANEDMFIRSKIAIKEKLGREDIKEVGLILEGYYTEDFFKEIKDAVEITDTLKDVKKRDLDFTSDLLWAFQVILSDNTAYILIFSDPYQDPWGKVKEYMKLEYMHPITTPVELQEKNIAYRK